MCCFDFLLSLLFVWQGYLQRFGFLNESVSGSHASLVSGETFSDAIKEFQLFAQINETGMIALN